MIETKNEPFHPIDKWPKRTGGCQCMEKAITPLNLRRRWDSPVPVKGGVVTHPLRGIHPGNTIVASMITLSLQRSPTNAASL